MMKEKLREKCVKVRAITLLTLLLPCASLLFGCTNKPKIPIQTLPGYQLSLFTSGNTAYRNPDGVAVDQGHVFIDYQNITKKDGSDNKASTIVEYNVNDGQESKKFSIPGHSDGLRVDPATHWLWALSNENKNPILTIINPDNGEYSSVYTFCLPSPSLCNDISSTEHGGGYDDLYFLKGYTYPFLSASDPTLDSAGNNNHASVYQVTNLEDGKDKKPGHVHVTPILVSGTSAIDVFTNTTVRLNEVDPDSLSADQGDLILINQVGSELVRIKNPGTSLQKVSRLRLGTQIDDTVWIPPAPEKGHLLIVDASRNQTYWMDATFTPGTVYTETYPDSSVQSVVGQLDLHTGALAIVATGFLKPTGLLFVPN